MPSIPIGTLIDIRRKLNYEPGTRSFPQRKIAPNRIGSGNSTCVASLKFDPDEDLATGDLTVEFVGPPSGGQGTYTYHNVPYEEYINFSQAASLGTYFNLYIKDQFSYDRT